MTARPVEFALLLLLATLWGASFTFIKVGVETIPPVTFIAGRTAIAAIVLLAVMRYRGIALPTDPALWRRFLFQACLNSVFPVHADRVGRAVGRRGPRDHPQFVGADLHVPADLVSRPAGRPRPPGSSSASSPA